MKETAVSTPGPGREAPGDPRLVIISNGNYFALTILRKVLDRYQDRIAGVVIITGDYRARTGFKALWELGKVTAAPYLIYKVLSVLAFRAAELAFPKIPFGLERAARAKGLPCLSAGSVKSPEVVDWIASLAPGLVISVSCPQMIGRKILDLPRLGAVNIHSSLLPRYAGLAPYFWVLSGGEAETGTTVHYMTMKFDEGHILGQRRIPIEKNESAFHLFCRLAQAGQDLLYQAVAQALQGDPGRPQDRTNASYFSNPTYRAYRQLRGHRHRLMRIRELVSCIRRELP